MSVIDKDWGFKRIQKELNSLQKVEITVGIHYSAGRNEKAVSGSDVLVAQYAYNNEFGTGNTPARPFITTAFDENVNKWETKIASNVAAIYEDQKSLKNAVGEIAYLASGDTVKKLDSIVTPPNARSTIEKKGSSKPLVDTGKMKASILPVITYV